MRALLLNLMADRSEALNIRELTLPLPIATSPEPFEDVTGLDPSLLTREEIEMLRPALHDILARTVGSLCFVKTHDAWVANAAHTPILGQGAKAAIYMVRDPRDVAVSWAHHFDCTIAEAVHAVNGERLDSPDPLPSGPRRMLRRYQEGWSDHVRSWLDQTCIPVFPVRYEDLKADTAASLRSVANFAEMNAGDEQISEAAARSDFRVLAAQEQSTGFHERVSRFSPFFREGKTGQWHEALSEHQAHDIVSRNSDVMRRLGYLP